MPDRREFLGIGAACALALTTRGRRDPARIAVVSPPAAGATSAVDGVRFGIEEATLTWELLGRRLEVVASPLEAIAVISLTDVAPVAPLVVDARARFACSDHAGVFRVGTARADALLWHPSLERYGATQLNRRFEDAVGRPMDGDAWAGWFAAKVLGEAILRARSDDPAAIAAWLRGPRARFDGHKGAPLHFDESRRLVQPLYLATEAGIESLSPAEPCAT